MEQIARFRLKPDYELDISKFSPHAIFINKEATHSVFYSLCESITVNIGFPDDLSKWNDIDYILVLDEDFCQPYTPFYACLDRKIEKSSSPFLAKVIVKYNEILRSLPYLEEIECKTECM